MQSTKSLPATYGHRGTFSLSNPRLVIGLNVAATVLFVVWIVLFLKIAASLHPELNTIEIRVGSLLQILPILVLPIFSIVLHELVHGVFLWLFTREFPRFGLKGLFAYASSPGWYIPRNQYVVVALAPFVLITLTGIGCLLFLPLSAALPVILIMAANAAGAVGDMVITGWIFTRSPVTFVSETDALDVTIY